MAIVANDRKDVGDQLTFAQTLHCIAGVVESIGIRTIGTQYQLAVLAVVASCVGNCQRVACIHVAVVA